MKISPNSTSYDDNEHKIDSNTENGIAIQTEEPKTPALPITTMVALKEENDDDKNIKTLETKSDFTFDDGNENSGLTKLFMAVFLIMLVIGVARTTIAIIVEQRLKSVGEGEKEEV